MDSLNEKQKIITGILLEEIDDKELRKVERKLKTTEYNFDCLGEVYKMEIIDKIYQKIGELFTKEEAWFYCYNLKWISTLRVYEKMGKINRYLNNEKRKEKQKLEIRLEKWKGFNFENDTLFGNNGKNIKGKE